VIAKTSHRVILNLIQNHDALFSVQRVLARGKRLFSTNGEPFNGKPLSLALTNPRPATTGHGSHKPRSRNKFGMTVLLDCENVTSRHSELDSESRCSFQRPACLSKREAALLGERGTTQRLTSFSCSYEPPTCYHRPRFCEMNSGWRSKEFEMNRYWGSEFVNFRRLHPSIFNLNWRMTIGKS